MIAQNTAATSPLVTGDDYVASLRGRNLRGLVHG